MRFGMPFSQFDSFSKVTEAFEILARVLSNLGSENFKNALPWSMIDKPKWLRLFDTARSFAESVLFKTSVTVVGNSETNGFTRLGTGAPKIKQQLFQFSNISGGGGATTSTTEFTADQVIDVSGVVRSDIGAVMPDGTTYPAGYEFGVYAIQSGGTCWIGYNVNPANDDNIDSGNADIDILVTFRE